MSQFTTFEKEVLVIKEKEKPYVIKYAPTNYISTENFVSTLTEINNKEPKATNKIFGVVKPGNGLIIIEPGVIELNLGKGLGIDPNSKKLIISAESYPEAGYNIEIVEKPEGGFRYDIVGEDILEPLSERVPKSKAVNDFVTSKTGDTSTITPELESVNLTSAINKLQERSTFKYKQMNPDNIWIINHPLQKYPSVTIVTENKQVVVGEIEYISDSQVKVSFTSGFSGSAYLN
jgi:hypothetical protein